MSHEVETMAYAGQTPWHGLGELVPADLSPIQMLEKAGLDWSVEKRDLYYFSDDEESVFLAPGKKALIRRYSEADSTRHRPCQITLFSTWSVTSGIRFRISTLLNSLMSS